MKPSNLEKMNQPDPFGRNSGSQPVISNSQITYWVGSSPYQYDVWAPYDVQVDGPHQIPILRGVSALPEQFELVSYSRKPRNAPQGNSVVNFWEADHLFAGVFSRPVNAATSLAKFSFVVSPDPTLYASNAEHMRINTIWRSRAVASYFEYRGLSVIPQIRWTTDSDLDAAMAGIQSRSVVAVSNHGCYRSEMSQRSFQRGLDRIVEQLSPSQLLLHGTQDSRLRGMNTRDTQVIHRSSNTGLFFEGGTVRG
jgi:hypothetical protein